MPERKARHRQESNYSTAKSLSPAGIPTAAFQRHSTDANPPTPHAKSSLHNSHSTLVHAIGRGSQHRGVDSNRPSGKHAKTTGGDQKSSMQAPAFTVVVPPSRPCTSQGVVGSVGVHVSIMTATHLHLHNPTTRVQHGLRLRMQTS